MKNISDIDGNFRLEPQIQKNGLTFYDINQPPFSIYGVFYEDGKYRRMPQAVAAEVSEAVQFLHTNTAGGRVRFCTDSETIAIIAKQDQVGKMPHFPYSGSIGFDLYGEEDGEEVYISSFMPGIDVTDGFESLWTIHKPKTTDFTINFPLYSNVNSLLVGVKEGSFIRPAKPYPIAKPIVYYGSSITQGGCASRPGNAYQSILSRRYHCDFINLGFSGSAKGEDAVFAYIKTLPMTAFVYDYDYNSPNPDTLLQTHEKGFLTVRKAHPDLPIILMSRPKIDLDPIEEDMLAVIRKTYDNAVARGDKNVYLVEGRKLMAFAQNDGTVDTVHPNDLGFYSMAKALGEVFDRILP